MQIRFIWYSPISVPPCYHAVSFETSHSCEGIVKQRYYKHPVYVALLFLLNLYFRYSFAVFQSTKSTKNTKSTNHTHPLFVSEYDVCRDGRNARPSSQYDIRCMMCHSEAKPKSPMNGKILRRFASHDDRFTMYCALLFTAV